MPEGTRVARCVEHLMAKGYSKEVAIKICQERTGQSYATGKKPKSPKKASPKKSTKKASPKKSPKK
jgi:hypothetical protein